MALDTTDPYGVLKAKLANLSIGQDFAMPKENEELYQDVPDFTLNLQQVEMTFPDDKYLDREGFYLYKATPELLEQLGSIVMPMFFSGFNTRGVIVSL